MTESPTPAAPGSRRTQSLIDIFMSVVIAMMLWPFPVARMWLSPPVHVAGVLVTIALAQLVYYALSAAVWHRTLGMQLAGIQLGSTTGEPVTRVRALQWGLVSALIAPWFALAPRSASDAAVAERVSRTTVY